MKHSIYKNKNIVTFYLSRKYLPFFKQFYLKENRKIPKEFKNANIEVINSLIEGILDGDSDSERRKIYIGSKTLVDDIQECLYKIGKASNYSVCNPKKTYLKSEDRYIIGKKPYYVISIIKTEYPIQVKNNVQWIDYNDMVYCVTLEKWHTVLIRRNGKTIWMGQCDPPYYNSNATYNENNGWTEQDEKDLLNLLDQLNDKNIKFALSNNFKYNNPFLKEWSKNYNIHYLNYNYNNCNYQKKDKNGDIEVLITNY